MTPEETLDWLAQQHYEQCREVRPIQDWIRKMKTQLPEEARSTHDMAIPNQRQTAQALDQEARA